MNFYRRIQLRRHGMTEYDAAWIASDEFWKSDRWNSLRYRVIEHHDAVCMACGKRRSDGIKINVDHVLCRRDFPWLAWKQSNLAVLCDLCNKAKGNWSRKDWRKRCGYWVMLWRALKGFR